MICKQEFINYLIKKLSYTYDKDKNTLLNNDIEVNADEFFNEFKKEIGQSFECIYDEHVSCFDILKCTECGTYIFEHYDEDYEHSLQCPVCTDYKTSFKFYTVADIEQDKRKQKEIEMYKELAKRDKEANERYIKRGGLHDWEKTHKKRLFKGKNYIVDIQFIGHMKWDLQAEINVWKKKDVVSVCKHHIKIPISPKTIWFFIKHKVKYKVTWKNV